MKDLCWYFRDVWNCLRIRFPVLVFILRTSSKKGNRQSSFRVSDRESQQSFLNPVPFFLFKKNSHACQNIDKC